MNIKNVIQNNLVNSNSIVSISDVENGLRLKKNSSFLKFSYTLDEINTIYGGIDGLLHYLKDNGYRNTTFKFRRFYIQKDRISYTNMSEFNHTFSEKKQFESQSNQNFSHEKQMPIAPNFLAGAIQNPHFLGALINSERVEDYKRKIGDLEETNKDLRSENRNLKEENFQLKLKEATIHEKTELKIEREVQKQKPFFESDSFKTVADNLSQLAGPLLTTLMTKGQSTQLGAPSSENLSPLHQKVTEMVKQADQEQLSLVVLALTDTKIQQLITDYLENDEH